VWQLEIHLLSQYSLSLRDQVFDREPKRKAAFANMKMNFTPICVSPKGQGSISNVPCLAKLLLLCIIFLANSLCAAAQERPYFVTYSHEMEEPGNFEIGIFSVAGNPPAGNGFLGSNIEFEYGVKTWWTSEFYLDGQSTLHDSTIFTGFRWENRFRPIMGEHWINPVLYVEFENVSADKALREVVGHDGRNGLLDANSTARTEKEREIELKLILGSNFRGWNISENIVAVKNVAGDPWEFGYALGVSRPLRLAASAHDCAFCAEKFQAGVEMYGGLGDRYSFGTRETSHYLGPSINWTAPNGTTLSFSPQFGLNDFSIPRLYRFGVSYEIDQFLSRFTSLRFLGGAR
jgi:hypothetical protein